MSVDKLMIGLRRFVWVFESFTKELFIVFLYFYNFGMAVDLDLFTHLLRAYTFTKQYISSQFTITQNCTIGLVGGHTVCNSLALF